MCVYIGYWGMYIGFIQTTDGYGDEDHTSGICPT